MLQNNGEKVNFDGYLTDVLTNKATQYIEDHKNNPFFMYLAYNAVHTPMHAKKEHLEKYKGHLRQKLAAMTWSLDENIGKLIKTLEQTNQLENTLIFFLSDNGGATNNQSLNGTLKGFKGNKFEGGHRVPFVVHWKGEIRGNQKIDGLSSSLDIFKTSLAAANINVSNIQLDGVDLLPYLKGTKQGNPHDALFWRKLEKSAVRIGDNKLIRLDEYGTVLYNLKNDLGETQDLSNRDLKTHNYLIEKLKIWEGSVMKPLWNEGDYWKDRNFKIHKGLMTNQFNDASGMKAYFKANIN
jgi:arylsulfatase A-like enzyme